MNILITGGCGFIGSHLAENLLQAGHDILVIDNYVTGRRDTLADPGDHLEVIEATIVEPEAVDPDEVDMLQDLIMAAMNGALKESRELAERKLAPLTGELRIPGLI